jgi:hypothetical protein
MTTPKTVWPTPPWIPAGAQWRGAPGRSALFGADHKLIPYWLDKNNQPQPERRHAPCSRYACPGTVRD